MTSLHPQTSHTIHEQIISIPNLFLCFWCMSFRFCRGCVCIPSCSFSLPPDGFTPVLNQHIRSHTPKSNVTPSPGVLISHINKHYQAQEEREKKRSLCAKFNVGKCLGKLHSPFTLDMLRLALSSVLHFCVNKFEHKKV